MEGERGWGDGNPGMFLKLGGGHGPMLSNGSDRGHRALQMLLIDAADACGCKWPTCPGWERLPA